MEGEKIMSPEEFEKEMASIQDRCGTDREYCHMEMDLLMMNVLCSLGYWDGIDVFSKTPKWYS